MKRLLYLCILLTLSGCADGGPAPAQLQLDDLRGQWVVINYWARWCKPCIEEIPELNALDRNHDNIRVLGVNYDGATGPDLEEQLDTLGVTFPTLQEDPAAQLGIPRPVVLPTTLVVNPTGKLSATLLGPQTLETLEAATINATPD